MEYLVVTDMTGKQYPYFIDEKGVKIEDFYVTRENYELDKIQNIIEKKETIRIQNRIFRVKKIIEISVVYR